MNTNQKLPSDTLAKPTRRLPWVLGGLGTIAIATAAVFAGPAIAAHLAPAPTPTPTVQADTPTVLTPAELAAVQSGADEQQAIIAADEAQAAAEAAAQAAAAAHSRESTGPTGSPHCPSGTSMTQGDANGDPEWCLPTSCFGASPGPECSTPVAAIKP